MLKARVNMAASLLLEWLPTFPARTASPHFDSGGGQAGMIIAAPRGRLRPCSTLPAHARGEEEDGHLNERDGG